MNTTISNPAKAVVMVLAMAILFVFSLSFTQKVMDGKNRNVYTSKELGYFEPPELSTIRTAAERNGIEYGSDDWYILLAIRKAENGEVGLEFGIMNPEANDLDSQAGWCAASIVKGRKRWTDSGKPEDFIVHFGRRYCPPDAHELNANWVGNVTYWFNKLKAGE